MGGWFFPSMISKGVDPSDLDDGMLLYYHDNLHILWSKLEEGYHFEWSFLEVFKLHHAIVQQMSKRGMKHYAPINDLDKVQYFSEIPQPIAYSVERKMNGFHATAHKKGDEVKIFSEQRKDLTSAFPTLTEEIKKLSSSDFIIDGELVPYENDKALGRNALMKYVGAVKSGKSPDDKNIKFHVWDITYLNKPLDDLPLTKRIEQLKKLNFTKRVPEIERRIVRSKDQLEKAIKWASTLPNSEGAVAKDLNATYSFGEHKSWKKYRKLTPLIVSVLKRVAKKRNLYNYLVGVPANKKFLDKRYIQDGKLVLGHTFNTDKIFEVGDKIKILIEEVWRHETNKGIHYSIHKPRVEGETDEPLSTIDDLEDIVTSIGVSVTHSEVDGFEVFISDELAEGKPKGEGKEIEVKNFPRRMQENFRKVMESGKWHPFVIQWHLRGRKSIHTDMRFKINGYLEGITLFTPPSVDKPDLLTEDPHNIRGTIKVPQPPEWLEVQGRIERGAPGSTKEFPSYFAIVGKGKYKIEDVSDHRILFRFKTEEGKVRKMDPPKGEEYVEEFNKKLPENYKQLNGLFSYHIAHIGDHHIILFDKVKEPQG